MTPIAHALGLEAGRLERVRIIGWLVLSLAITCAASVVMAIWSTTQGFVGFCLGFASTAWFALAYHLLQRGKWSMELGWVSLVLESSMPAALTAMLALGASADEALRAISPTITFAGLLTMSVLKLETRYTMTATVFVVVTRVLVIRFIVFPGLAVPDVHASWRGLLMESTFHLLAGGVAAYVTHALKGAFAGVAQRLEQHALFGKYRLEREIGAGGFGVVWAATYCPAGGFERPAAVKMVHTNLAGDEKLIAAFRAEAELGARLVHGNIVQVFDFGRVDDTYFFAMEFVEGDTLSLLLKRARAAQRRVPANVAAAITDDLLAALHHAHAEARDSLGRVLRVIHRDLGPANIIVSTSGVTKLADFGIARALRGSQAAATTTVVGHVDHMAPEQLNGEPLDPRCDLFAAGVLLWEMLCGRPLFRRDSDGATIAAVLRSEIPSPSSVHADLASLDAVVLRALERDRERRFASALEMKRALEAAVTRGTADDVARFVADLASVPTPEEASAVTESAPRPLAAAEGSR